jgi:hypothetical protein
MPAAVHGSRLAPLLLALGCVSTDGPAQSTFALCPDAPSTPVASSLVLINSKMGEGLLRCSGVVIAPTLVVTSMACAFRPSSLDDPGPTRRTSSMFYDAAFDFERFCDRSQGWAPREDGSFAASFGKQFEASAMSVYLASDPVTTFGVKSVFASGAVSPCTPGLALLELERETNVPPLSLRFDDLPPEEPVWLEGHCVDGRYLVTHGQASSVTALASAAGSEQAPPWSMLVEGGALATDIGGAVVTQTGALTGVIVSGAGQACSEAGSEALAVRISAFRKMLLETARERGVDLRVEPFSEGVPDPGIAACVPVTGVTGH